MFPQVDSNFPRRRNADFRFEKYESFVPSLLTLGAQFAHTALVSVGKAGRGVAVLAAFSSEEMIDVHGSCKVDVVE